MSGRIDRLSRARLYLVCGEQPDVFLQAALRGGVDIVQLRMKQATDARIITIARRFADACAEHAALFILNDRPDLVAEAGADGVHVGQDDVPIEQARELLEPDRLIGLSTHTPAQVRGAEGADYIGVGPVNETPTKPGRTAVGLELVRYAAEHATMPFFAIGGITAANARSVRSAGGTRVAVVRAITGADDPTVAARALREAIARGRNRVGST